VNIEGGLEVPPPFFF